MSICRHNEILVTNRAIFFFVVAFTIPTLGALATIRSTEIDYDLARGADDGKHRPKASSIFTLFKDRPLVIFLICAVLFHFANAAMLPLLGEMLSKGHGRASMMFMSACVVTTQIVVTFLAAWSGVKARQWGRKPLLLIAFGVLPIRGVLYTLTSSASSLVAIQVLDGVGAAIFGVVSVLVIADLTRGTGRFNLTLGAVTTAVGIGAALSQSVAGGTFIALAIIGGFCSWRPSQQSRSACSGAPCPRLEISLIVRAAAQDRRPPLLERSLNNRVPAGILSADELCLLKTTCANM